jgi:hypothetical protein
LRGSLEDLTKGATVKGILPDGVVTVVDAHWHGSVLELTYKDSAGRLANELLYRDREPSLEVVASGAPWSFDGDGKMLRLVSEAHRIRLAYLFDPLLAIHTSVLEPLPHQIDLTGTICTKWNERESTWRKSGHAHAEVQTRANCDDAAAD